MAAGDTITLDIDAANFDTIIEFLDTDGVTSLAFGDDDNGANVRFAGLGLVSA